MRTQLLLAAWLDGSGAAHTLWWAWHRTESSREAARSARGPQEVVRQGVVDPQRVAVGGHSYGAFMAANLLAHAGVRPGCAACAQLAPAPARCSLQVHVIGRGDRRHSLPPGACTQTHGALPAARAVPGPCTQELFACGIARSGAYNRTMTPFGFQAEERTIWQAPDTYQTMSPFNQAGLAGACAACHHARWRMDGRADTTQSCWAGAQDQEAAPADPRPRRRQCRDLSHAVGAALLCPQGPQRGVQEVLQHLHRLLPDACSGRRGMALPASWSSCHTRATATGRARASCECSACRAAFPLAGRC